MPILLDAQHLSLPHPLQPRPMLAPVNLQLRSGQLCVLLGPNGAGKSTLLRTLAGLQANYQGQLHWLNQPLQQLDYQARSRLLAYLPQQPQCAWGLQVEDVVALGRLPHGKAQLDNVVEAILSQTDCQRLRQRSLHQLSGGEQARVLLARALAVQAPLLLADEPIAGLDPRHQLQMMQLLQDYSREQGVLLVLHDLNLAARFADQIWLLDEQGQLTQGPPAEVLTAERLQQVYGPRFACDWQRQPPLVEMLGP
ncbi:ABC transporter ATP-binding protein [Balneatrix alpica]|uniref:ABC transporter ATP-binding protein n=1 Tax=Balneatrix alpica TaxID=75684 RepID=A0ABV5ZDD7_9GAMM|nr:ABC transporter ATP-binding protein [Balneatrix alpica]